MQRLLKMAKTWPDEVPHHGGPPARTTCRTARRLSPDEIDALVEAYRSGLTVYQIAQQFGMHRSAVGRHLAARDVHTRQLVLSPTEIREAAELYRSGQRLKDLAERYGVSITTVNRILAGHGVQMRPGGRVRRQRIA